MCAVLYVFGMSTWNRFACNESGPNVGIYYGSLILNVLIIYAFLRRAFVYFKNGVITTYNNAINGGDGEVSFFLRFWIDAWSCKPDPVVAPIIYIICVGIFIACLSIALAVSSKGRLDGSSHIWYMLGGVVIAWLYECIFKTIFYPIKVVAPPKFALMEAVGSTENKYILWVEKILLLPVVDFEGDRASSTGRSESVFESSILWRFLPDGLFVINGVILSGFGLLHNTLIASAFRWIVVQVTASMFIVASLLQRGESRKNISRFLLETPFMNVVGKSSFFMYLLQTAAFNFYARVIVDDVRTHSFPLPKDNAIYVSEMWSFNWYRQLPLGPKIAGFLCLLAISWFLQTYYQDLFVSTLANRLLSYNRKIQKNKLNPHP